MPAFLSPGLSLSESTRAAAAMIGLRASPQQILVLLLLFLLLFLLLVGITAATTRIFKVIIGGELIRMKRLKTDFRFILTVDYD